MLSSPAHASPVHASALAFEAPLLCAMVTFAAAILFFYAWRIGMRPWYVLVAVGGWLAWTVYFGALAVTAGPAPRVSRAELALMVRWAELIGGVLLAVWLVFWIRFGTQVPAWNVPDCPPEGSNPSGAKDSYTRTDAQEGG